MDYQNLSLRIEGQIARLSLNRPSQGNRLDLRTLRELDDAAAAIDAAPDVMITTIDAAGEDFCLGWDQDARDQLAVPSNAYHPFESIAALKCATVATVQGRVTSSGLELALACDMRICADDTVFALPDLSEGSLPLAGATQRLPRLVGKARALDMLLAGTEIDAATAYTWGLVSRAVAREDLSQAVSTLAQRIAERGPIAVRYAKEAVSRGLEMSLEQALRYETDLSIILQTTYDRGEGVRAFFERRPARFEGR